MTSYRALRLDSIAALRAAAAQWDDLWRRSDSALPTVQAEPLATWLERFASGGRFLGLVVEQGGKFATALPLAGVHVQRRFEVAGLPGEDWFPGGDLLLDPACDAAAAMDRLVAELARVRWPLVWIWEVSALARRWREFLDAVRRAGLSHDVAPHHEIGWIDLGGDWGAFFSDLRGDFRRNLRRWSRSLEEQGPLVYRRYDGKGGDLAEMLRRVFSVEEKSWKAKDGSAVLAVPGLLDFFADHSRWLAERRQLVVGALELAGRPIAFEYGYAAKGVYFPYKTSFDEELARLSPTHSLRWRHFEELCRSGTARYVDFLGPISDAVRRWTKHSYRTSRIIVSPNRVLSRAVLLGYQRLLPFLRRLRSLGRKKEETLPAAAPVPPVDALSAADLPPHLAGIEG
ncbi:MAG: GNAT family N-acetyltransferase [Planctomycetia bacterium]|nr:GNAT family N-acetyltransferase [Planctomycetia bacterium]